VLWIATSPVTSRTSDRTPDTDESSPTGTNPSNTDEIRSVDNRRRVVCVTARPNPS
jgi:hypothetical protein